MNNYILEDGKPVVCDDILTWGKWFEKHDQRVAYTQIDETCCVSTVFLGINHNFFGKGDPILWETMIFGGKEDGYQDRYSSESDAREGHERAVRIARGEESA